MLTASLLSITLPDGTHTERECITTLEMVLRNHDTFAYLFDGGTELELSSWVRLEWVEWLILVEITSVVGGHRQGYRPLRGGRVMIPGKYYTQDCRSARSEDFPSWESALLAMHDFAAVAWDRDLADFDLPADNLHVEVTPEETYPALWGYGNVVWGHNTLTQQYHARLVEDPVVGPRWLLVGDNEAFNNYCACIRLLGLHMELV